MGPWSSNLSKILLKKKLLVSPVSSRNAPLVTQRSSPTGAMRDETKTVARETKKLSTYSPMKTVQV